MRIEWLVICMFAPVATVAVAWLMLLTRPAGQHPFFGLQPSNLVEAAAFRDGGALVRRVEAGEDPNRPDTVRAGIFGPQPAALTPLEAAAAQRRAEIVNLLINLGAAPDARVWTRAWCISEDADVRAVLDRHRPADAEPGCAASDAETAGSR
jgi:hypothetical protein